MLLSEEERKDSEDRQEFWEEFSAAAAELGYEEDAQQAAYFANTEVLLQEGALGEPLAGNSTDPVDQVIGFLMPPPKEIDPVQQYGSFDLVGADED